MILNKKEAEMLWDYLKVRPWIEVNDLCVMLIKKVKDGNDNSTSDSSGSNSNSDIYQDEKEEIHDQENLKDTRVDGTPGGSKNGNEKQYNKGKKESIS